MPVVKRLWPAAWLIGQLATATPVLAQEASGALVWEPVVPGEEVSPAQAQQELAEAEALRAAAVAPARPAWVTGGLFQISRGEQGLPSITQRLPNGFGSRFLGLETGLFGSDCGVSGNYVCGDGSRSWSEEVTDLSENDWLTSFGLGDPIRAIGLDLGITISSLASARSGQETEGTPFGSGRGLNLAISRNLGPDLGLKLGAFNLVELDEVQKDAGKSAYALVSGRFDLGGPPQQNTNDLYFTAGLANGLYRPLDTILKDQRQACNALRRRKGPNLSEQQERNCNAEGLNYGTPNPVGALAWVINPQLSLLAEWWGRNLTLAVSVRPIAGVNWVITPGVTNLVKNADWDPDLPGYTERVRLQLTTSYAF